MVPMTVIARGEGPTVLCLGGNHGDEYQGQVAIMRLAREVTPEQVIILLSYLQLMVMPRQMLLNVI
jgi:predicted deacylase